MRMETVTVADGIAGEGGGGDGGKEAVEGVMASEVSLEAMAATEVQSASPRDSW